MLVISRKPHEKILIPAIKASIHVAAVQPGVVRVAIDAPPEVVILRGEVADRAAEWGQPLPQGPPALSPLPAHPVKNRRAGHRLRERLRVASMTMGMARLQLRTSLNPEAEAVLHKVQRQIEALCRHLDRKKGRAMARPAQRRRTVGHAPSMPREYSPKLLQAVDA